MTRTTTAQTAAEKFVAEAHAAHFTVEVKGYSGSMVVTVQTTFTPGNADEYSCAESFANTLLARVPMTYPGTVWGTDGASVGGHAGLTGGYMRLNKSGVGARFANAVRKALR